MNFAERFRPENEKQLIGEDQVRIATSLLERTDDPIREVLFVGPSGVGKTTISRMYIKALLKKEINNNPNVHIVNCSAQTGIDFMREIIDKFLFLPLDSKYTVFFLDEIHGLSVQAQNALLAKIEPIPEHVIMVASTTNPEKLIPTLVSRFTQYKLPVPTTKDFQKKAFWISKALNIEFDKTKVDEIIGIAGGNVRTFDRYLQQLAEGSYSSFEESEDRGQLFDLVFKARSTDMPALFREASKEKDYSAACIGLCYYAIKVLGNSANLNQPIYQRAQKVLSVFGDGLNPKVPDKVSFFGKLSELIK